MSSIRDLTVAVFFSCSFVLFFVRAQNKFGTNSDFILWSPTRHLGWEDFCAKPDAKSNYKAMTFSKIYTEVVSTQKDSIVYNVSCLFDKQKSWTKKHTATLLKHEQLHFDITELAVRKMRKKLSESKCRDLAESLNELINNSFNEAVSEIKLLNKKYDGESNHGLNTKEQQKWEKYIAEQLKAFSKFSSPQVVIRRMAG